MLQNVPVCCVIAIRISAYIGFQSQTEKTENG